MTNTNVTIKCTSGTSKLVRAKFGPGMLLQHEDLEQLNRYTRDLSRLLFRSFFGCGVVCGLVVTADQKPGKLHITVGAGLALDCNGDPVYLPKDQPMSVGDDCEDIPNDLWVVLCGKTKYCAPRTAECASDDEPSSVCTREWDCYELRVVRTRPKCVCGCPEPTNNQQPATKSACNCVDPTLVCYQDHYEGSCGCNCGECSDGDWMCILLARLHKDGVEKPWLVDHRVRRFIRPVLIRDPQVEIEEKNRTQQQGQGRRPAPPPPPPVVPMPPAEPAEPAAPPS